MIRARSQREDDLATQRRDDVSVRIAHHQDGVGSCASPSGTPERAAFVVRRDLETKYAVALGFIAILFNPLIPVYLSKLLWVPIDLGVAYFFWRLTEMPLSRQSEEPSPEGPPAG